MLISQWIWLRKSFLIKIVGSFFINLRLLVVYLTYSPGYDTSNIPMYMICSWMMANNDWKITDIILFIGSTLGNIHSKYSIVYLWISFALGCICWIALLTQR